MATKLPTIPSAPKGRMVLLAAALTIMVLYRSLEGGQRKPVSMARAGGQSEG